MSNKNWFNKNIINNEKLTTHTTHSTIWSHHYYFRNHLPYHKSFFSVHIFSLCSCGSQIRPSFDIVLDLLKFWKFVISKLAVKKKKKRHLRVIFIPLNIQEIEEFWIFSGHYSSVSKIFSFIKALLLVKIAQIWR